MNNKINPDWVEDGSYEKIVNELEYRLDSASNALKGCYKRKDLCRAQLERYSLHRIENDNKQYIEENLALTSQISRLEKQLHDLRKQSPESHKITPKVVYVQNCRSPIMDDVYELKEMFYAQEGTIKLFNEALDENKRTNEKLHCLINTITDSKLVTKESKSLHDFSAFFNGLNSINDNLHTKRPIFDFKEILMFSFLVGIKI